MKTIRIAIAGLGAVGGYYGGKLAHYYKDSKEVEIYFIARGKNERAIKENGLRVESAEGTFTAFPKEVTSNAYDIGVMDYILCSPKSYDLDNMLEELKPCVGAKTVMILVMNGVDIHDLARGSFPDNPLWMACTYITSRLVEPGVVKESGKANRLFFGSPHIHTSPEQGELLDIMRRAGINAEVPLDIKKAVWEKFFHISPIATLSSYLNVTFQQIYNNPLYTDELHELYNELKAVAEAKHIDVDEKLIEKTLSIISKMPAEVTSSMHTDFQKGHKTEVESLTGYVVREANELDIPVPLYQLMYERLVEKEREQSRNHTLMM